MNLRDQFVQDGFIIVEGFVPQSVLEEIKLEILQLIKLMFQQESPALLRDLDFNDSSNLDEAFLKLRQFNPQLTSKIYAASKKLPSIAQFVTSDAHLELARKLIGSKNVAFSDRGWGLRIDYPNDVKYATPLHQDIHTQLGSTDGIVIWIPLTDVKKDMGPLIFYPNSDNLGILKVKKIDNDSKSTDLEIEINPTVLAEYRELQPEVKAGTAVVINYLLLHKSGSNFSNKCRWSILSRRFNFEDKVAIARGWHGGIQEGYRFEDVYPEFKL
jgi:hypothetical protein